MKEAPCRGCDHRSPACHDKCGIYKDWCRLRDRAKRNAKSEANVRQYEVDHRRERKKKWNSGK